MYVTITSDSGKYHTYKKRNFRMTFRKLQLQDLFAGFTEK